MSTDNVRAGRTDIQVVGVEFQAQGPRAIDLEFQRLPVPRAQEMRARRRPGVAAQQPDLIRPRHIFTQPRVRHRAAGKLRGVERGQARAVTDEAVGRVVERDRARIGAGEIHRGNCAAQLKCRQRPGEVAGSNGVRRGRERLTGRKGSEVADGGANLQLQPAIRAGKARVEIQRQDEQAICDSDDDLRGSIGGDLTAATDRIPKRGLEFGGASMRRAATFQPALIGEGRALGEGRRRMKED